MTGRTKLRLSELYTSVQGEGPNVGKPVQFVRFAGCNMRCPGWPCDTQHAIDPKLFMQEGASEKLTAQELMDRVQEWPRALVLTGGEPFLQPETPLREFCQLASEEDYSIECFTNGTVMPFPPWAMQRMSFVLDWKLPGSGEVVEGPRHHNRILNATSLRRYDTVKFTVKDRHDFNTAVDVQRLLSALPVPRFTVGRVWEGGELRDRDIVDLIMHYQLQWTLNVQLHNHIWPAHERMR